jgi:hypothetical protein
MRTQVPADFQVGFGSEVEEEAHAFPYLPWLLVVIGLVALYIVGRRRRRAKRTR